MDPIICFARLEEMSGDSVTNPKKSSHRVSILVIRDYLPTLPGCESQVHLMVRTASYWGALVQILAMRGVQMNSFNVKCENIEL